jgi:hypothetical protein
MESQRHEYQTRHLGRPPLVVRPRQIYSTENYGKAGQNEILTSQNETYSTDEITRGSMSLTNKTSGLLAKRTLNLVTL